MNIQPIRNDRDYQAALGRIASLMHASPNTPEGDELDILATLVEAYEEINFTVLPPDPIEAILHVIEAQGLSRRELEPFLGSRARVSEVLNRKRPLTLTMIQRLSTGLKIPTDILLGVYPRPSRARPSQHAISANSQLQRIHRYYVLEATSGNTDRLAQEPSPKISASRLGHLLPFDDSAAPARSILPAQARLRYRDQELDLQTSTPSSSFAVGRLALPQVVDTLSELSA